MTMDWSATLLDAAGVPADPAYPLDGVSLLPVLRDAGPERLAAMREAWEAWNASMPPIPEDASISLGYSARDMPQR